MLASIVYGLLSAMGFGFSDTLVALLMRRYGYGALVLLIGVQGVGVGVLVGVYALGAASLQPLWTLQQVLLGVGLGIVTTGAYLSFYKAIALGPLALVSPISSSYAAVTVVLAFIVLHEAIVLPVVGGIGMVLAGIVLASIPMRSTGERENAGGKRQTRQFAFISGGSLALVAMGGFGIELFLLSLWSKVQGPLFPVLFLQMFMSLACLLILFAQRHSSLTNRRQLSVWKPLLKQRMDIPVLPEGAKSMFLKRRVSAWKGFLLLLLCGGLNAGGLLFYNFGTTRGGYTSVEATLTSTYSLLPLLFGVFFLRERISRLQGLGVIALLIGIVYLSGYQLL